LKARIPGGPGSTEVSGVNAEDGHSAAPSLPPLRPFWRRLSDGALPALLPIALATVVFFPITRNYFYQDDFVHLYRLVNHGPLENLLVPHAGHISVARNAVFWLFFTLFATATPYYFAVVLLTHLLNVYLLFAVIRAQTGSAAVACFGAALWGTCRMNEGALGCTRCTGRCWLARVCCGCCGG
jgi:hypothetical protein